MVQQRIWEWAGNQGEPKSPQFPFTWHRISSFLSRISCDLFLGPKLFAIPSSNFFLKTIIPRQLWVGMCRLPARGHGCQGSVCAMGWVWQWQGWSPPWWPRGIAQELPWGKHAPTPFSPKERNTLRERENIGGSTLQSCSASGKNALRNCFSP